MDRAAGWAACRIAYVESSRAIGQRTTGPALERFRGEWHEIAIVEVDAALTEAAAELAIESRLRSLDALHLAAALRIRGDDLVFVSWDTRLAAAARASGLEVLGA